MAVNNKIAKILLLASLASSLCLAESNESKESEDAEYDITIHALPHTHLDAGWIHTIDYYFENHVLDIFSTVIPELEQNPSYRFNWAEVGFLKIWWDRMDSENDPNELKERFRKLVYNG